MVGDLRSDGQIAREDAAEARHEARAVSISQADIVHRLDDLRTGMAQMATAQTETRADIARVELIAREGRDQAKVTNGRVTQIDLWRAEMKGVAQGAGGTGRLLLYMLSAAAGTGTIIVTAMKVLEQ